MDHVKGTQQSVQLLFFSFLLVKQWLGMNMREPVSGQTKGLSTPGSFSDSCRYLQYKSMSKMQWYFLSDPEAAQSSATSIWLDIGFGNVWRNVKDLILFSRKAFKMRNKYNKGSWRYPLFFHLKYRWDLICSSNNLQVKVVYSNHTQSFFSMSEQKTKANYTLHDFRLWEQTVKSTKKRNATVKKNHHNRNSKNLFSSKIYQFSEILKWKIILDILCLS